MILCVGTTPAAQRVMVFERLHPGEVNRAAITLDGYAGKSVNVAKVLSLLGVKTCAAGFCGGERGARLLELLRDMGIQTDFVRLGIETRQCITVIDRASGVTTELVEESAPAPRDCYERLLAIVAQRVPHCRAMVLSGTLTSGGPETFYRDCLELAHHAGCLTVVDAKGAPLQCALQASPAVVKPNRAELSDTVGRELHSDYETLAAMGHLIAGGARHVVVTSGAGPILARDSHYAWRIVPPSIEAANPIGSGDAFTAAMTWRLVEGASLGEACRYGAAAGAANALSLMPGELKGGEVAELLAQVQLRVEG